jgi:hypothetical protein
MAAPTERDAAKRPRLGRLSGAQKLSVPRRAGVRGFGPFACAPDIAVKFLRLNNFLMFVAPEKPDEKTRTFFNDLAQPNRASGKSLAATNAR